MFFVNFLYLLISKDPIKGYIFIPETCNWQWPGVDKIKHSGLEFTNKGEHSPGVFLSFTMEIMLLFCGISWVFFVFSESSEYTVLCDEFFISHTKHPCFFVLLKMLFFSFRELLPISSCVILVRLSKCLGYHKPVELKRLNSHSQEVTYRIWPLML